MSHLKLEKSNFQQIFGIIMSLARFQSFSKTIAREIMESNMIGQIIIPPDKI